MDVLFLISVFRKYPRLKMSFEHNSVCMNLFLSACFCWDSSLSLHEMDHKFKFGGLIGYGNCHLDSISLLQSFQTSCNIIRRCWSCSITKWKSTWLLLYDWARAKFLLAWPRDWTLLPLRKTLSTLHFLLCQLLKLYVLHCTRYRAN